MQRLTPQHWKTLERIFLSAGFSFVRQASSHRVYEKPGVLRPVIIPEYEEVDVAIIQRLLRTAGLSRDAYFRLLNKG
ncbi:MAG: type II toxin-antitoxin system HicA family toxin [Desulfovibrio sp.]|jgi:predicted RNA binding protein YcfA (HicA-like mRNA interferase family)|nr:type II toxin-antitoxin system HicA family toxin [Desulfovibrio sp.]